MKRITFLFAVLAVFLWVGSAVAGPFGTNITIYDNRKDTTSSNSWYSGENEDQEVEPEMVNKQSWDLEGFFLNGTTLTMVGGFDFVNGNSGYTSGDIFIDTDGDASFGIGASSANNFGYDYVFDLDFVNDSSSGISGTYGVYELNSKSELVMPLDYNDPESSPWQFNPTSSDKTIATGTIGLYGYSGYDAVPNLGFVGDWHYAVSVDLARLFDLGYTDFTSHFTMECGNDNLMGQGTAPVPEPATMLLFGTGLIGLAFVGRKKLLKKQG